MNVLVANTTCKVGGVSTFMLSLRSALVASGHRCELFFLEHGPMERHLPRGVTVHFGTLTDLIRLVERDCFDVVHANNSDWPSGISAVRRVGAKLVVTAHKVREPAWTYAWTTRECDALVAVSHWVARELQPFSDLLVQAVPNGVDTCRFRPDIDNGTSPPILAWVGRGSAPVKRIESLAAIAPTLRRAGIRIWVIDQQGPEKVAESFPEAAATLRALAEVWRGVAFDTMPEVYRHVAASGGALLSTASSEGLPLALLEAQACGCVAIGADVRGVNETISRDHGGVLYPLELEPDRLADLVVTTLADRAAMRSRQQRAAAHVRTHFSLTRMAEHYVRVYTESPYASAPHGWRTRQRLSPIFRRRSYMGQRWGVAHRQYEAARELGGSGDWRLAAAAARASFVVAPTLYIRPSRLAYLLRAHWRGCRLRILAVSTIR